MPARAFALPDRLYGREAERARLLEAVELAGQGSRVLVTVAGSSGIGKTALVNDIARRVAATRGKVASGKFDQFRADLPYLGMLKAMRGLLRRELAEPAERLAERRDALQQALGIHGQLLTAALPKVFESLDGWSLAEQAAAELGTARYRFQHDRVRQTVHERLDDERRARRHLRIGRLLMHKLAPAELDQRVVEVFTHVVYGVHLLDDRAERDRLAALGLAAGLRAQRGLAFEGARKMLHAAAALLSPDAWRDDHDTAIGIHLALAQCAHALMLGDEFEAHSAIVIEHARTVVHSAEGHGLRIRARHAQNRYAEAVDIGVEVAAALGVKLPRKPRKPRLPHVLWGVVQALGVQRGRDPLVLADLGAADDAEMRAAVSLLCSVVSAAYFAEPNLLPLIGMTCTRLSIRHGMTPQSPYGFAVWALVLCGVLGRIDNGYHYGSLALEIGRRYGGADESRARFVVDVFIKHWKEPLPEVAQLLQADWARNRDAGDSESESATYCAGVLLYTHFVAGGSLDAHERYADSIRYLVDCGQTQVKHCFLAWVELYAALRMPELPDELDGQWFSYTRLLPEFEKSRNAVQIAISSIAAGVLDHFAGRFERTEQRFAVAARWEETSSARCWCRGWRSGAR